MDVDVKDHLERDVKTICAYCGKEFRIDEVYIEQEIHGRVWRFCSERCLLHFRDAIDYREPDEDDDHVIVGEEE